jgi:hypothetical protein
MVGSVTVLMGMSLLGLAEVVEKGRVQAEKERTWN